MLFPPPAPPPSSSTHTSEFSKPLPEAMPGSRPPGVPTRPLPPLAPLLALPLPAHSAFSADPPLFPCPAPLPILQHRFLRQHLLLLPSFLHFLTFSSTYSTDYRPWIPPRSYCRGLQSPPRPSRKRCLVQVQQVWSVQARQIERRKTP